MMLKKLLAMIERKMMVTAMSIGLWTMASAQHCQLSLVVQDGCLGDNSGWAMVVSVTGAATPYTILWSTGDTTAYVAGLPNGNYTVTITDDNDCMVSGQVTIDCVFVPDCDFRTFTQGGWGAPAHGNNPGVYLHEHFAACFTKGVTIGCGSNTMTLSTAQAVTNFLPSGTTARPLPSGAMLDPGQSYRNVLAGQLVSAILNVRFDVCDPDFSEANGALGALTFIGGPFDGLTVNQVIALANQFMGGCGSSYTAAQFNTALTNVNENYDNGNDQGDLLCNGTVQLQMMHAGHAEVTMTVYPVPATDLLNVELPTNDGTAMIALYDLAGREVISSRNVAGVREVLNVSRIPAGSYLLTVQMNGQVTSHPIVVSK